MASKDSPHNIYRHAQETISPSNQIIMCYCSAISFVQQAREAVEKHDHDKRYMLIDKTMAIMRSLRACLDFENNPTVAHALNNYYESLDNLLIAVQCEDNKLEICDNIIKNLRTIKEAWENVTASSEQKIAATPPLIALNNYAPKDMRT